tara:strand:- start:610 stop:1422 length:813 start_codon:yes stop_codon:yes gene_type:complete
LKNWKKLLQQILINYFFMSIKFTILGSGSSLGIPRIDGNFGRCNPKNQKNYRMRCSALISDNKNSILIDTSPDIKSQLLKNKVKNIDRVFYTHSHADQTHGINELRVFYLKNKKKINIYADNSTKRYLLKSFGYCFKNIRDYPSILKMNNLKKFHQIKNIRIKPIKVKHGLISSYCYMINNICGYAPDVSKIYDKDLKYFYNLKYLVVDCLRYDWHPSHFNLKSVLNLVEKIKPKKTILTNINSDIDHEEVKKHLPKNIVPGYDGMNFKL